MITIQKKILLLSLFIWFIMSGLWLFINYNHQQSIQKYNEILQRYLLINHISQLSESSIKSLNSYLLHPALNTLEQYEKDKLELKDVRTQLNSLRNKHNSFELTNYQNMISSQIENMDTAVNQEEKHFTDMAAYYSNDAAKISKFIAEATLSLVNGELTSYNQFYRSIIQQSTDLEKMGVWILAMASSILMILSYWVSTGISQPIRALILEAREIARGNFSNNIKVESNDEISFLARTINTMRIEIKNLFQEMKKKAQLETDLNTHKFLLKEAELKSLQSQINPHFLFNTLNTISKKAYLEGANETNELIISVSELLRYNLKRLNTTVTLEQEMKVLDEYLNIQKARFMDRVHYQKIVADACLDFSIPCLTLQPFIENAFIHAIEPSETGGEIILQVQDTEEHVLVVIEDNGIGMNQEKMEEILSDKETQQANDQGHSTGIGIRNVIRRLRLFYGVHDIIEIQSEVGKGTKIFLYLPKQRRDLL